MAYEPDWLRIARAEADRGVKEIPGAIHHHPRILTYQQHTSLRATDDETPWCSSFACFCVDEAGPYQSTNDARARSWLRWGVEIDALYGCVVVLKRGKGPQPGREVISAPGHVGFLIDATHDEVLLLGGNQNDGVCIRPYPLADVLAFRAAA